MLDLELSDRLAKLTDKKSVALVRLLETTHRTQVRELQQAIYDFIDATSALENALRAAANRDLPKKAEFPTVNATVKNVSVLKH